MNGSARMKLKRTTDKIILSSSLRNIRGRLHVFKSFISLYLKYEQVKLLIIDNLLLFHQTHVCKSEDQVSEAHGLLNTE